MYFLQRAKQRVGTELPVVPIVVLQFFAVTGGFGGGCRTGDGDGAAALEIERVD